MTRHLPSIEALMAPDDRRLLEELEISAALEKLARVRSLIDRTDTLLTTVLACGDHDDVRDATSRLQNLFASIRRR